MRFDQTTSFAPRRRGKTGSLAAKETALRLKARQRRAPAITDPAHEQALAFKRYACLLIHERTIARMVVETRGGLSPEAGAWLVGTFRRAGVMAHPVTSRTFLIASGLAAARTLAEGAGSRRILARRLKTCLDEAGHGRAGVDAKVAAHLDRALEVLVRVDLPPAGAFAAAGFDLP